MSGERPRNDPRDREETSMEPRQTHVEPEAAPQRVTGSPEVRQGQFAFDNRSKIAQEIQKKYKNLPKTRDAEREHTAKEKAKVMLKTETPQATEKLQPRHSLPPKDKKRPSKPAQTKENKEQSYMRPTALAGLRNGSREDVPAKVKQIAQEQERRMKEECTFTPKINTGPYSNKLELNREERRARLCQPKTTDIQKRERLKQQRDAEEFAQVCTFQPQLATGNGQGLEGEMLMDWKTSEGPIGSRLHEQAAKRMEEQHKVAGVLKRVGIQREKGEGVGGMHVQARHRREQEGREGQPAVSEADPPKSALMLDRVVQRPPEGTQREATETPHGGRNRQQGSDVQAGDHEDIE
jgi:hypothetical protein